MTNFVRDFTGTAGLKGPVSDLFAAPVGDELHYADADKWNELRQATFDLRGWIKTGLTNGTFTNATLIVDADGRITGVASGAGSGVPTTRLISTTAPLAGGGDLSADRTLTVATFSTGAAGVVPASGAGTSMLRGDATWRTPTQVKADLAIASGDVSGLAATAISTNAANLTGTLPAAQMPALTGDVTTSVGAVATTIAALAVTTGKIAANAVTLAKVATQADQTILGNNTGGAAVPLALTAAQTRTVLGLVTVATSGLASDLTGTLAAAQLPALTGDVTSSAGSAVTTIAADAVANAKLANMANGTIKLRTTAGTGDPEDGTVAQLLAMLTVRLGEFGDASDGDATMDGSTAVTGYSLAGSTYTATGYAYFGNLTINAGITVNQHSWPGPICRGTCTNNGHVSWDGAAASGQTAGAASVATGPLPLGTAGGGGGAVNGGAGTNGTAGAANVAPRGFSAAAAAGGVGTITPAAVNPGTAGGVGHGGGGGGTLGNGGAGGGQSLLPAASGDWRQKHVAVNGFTPVSGGSNVKLAAGSGGGGGAGGGGVSGGVGGGGGAGGSWGVSKAFAYAGSGTWTANGGNGANGANATGIASDGGAGGGAGAGGILVFVSAGTPPTATVTAGTAGSGGTGQTTGRTGGAGGAAGAGLTELLF